MQPGEAVEYLLSMMEIIYGSEVDQLGYLPGVHLTTSEHTILRTMFRNEGRVVTREVIMNTIYPHLEDAPEQKIIDVFVCKIRAKISGQPFKIETVWGRGYRLVRDDGAVFPWEVDA